VTHFGRELDRIVVALSNPSFYTDGTGHVDIIQTHISFIFLTERHALKVKKPVNFGFLDYTTLEQRRTLCEREVALNRRLCPDTYLGVVAIRDEGGRLSLDGPGEPVEYAVKMMRLPEDRMLRQVLRRGEGDPAILQRIARTLADFHAAAETGPEIQAMKGLAGVTFNCEENFAQTEKYVGTLVPRERFEMIRTSTRLFLERRASLFEDRARRGRVRDGHGDLHLDSICVTEPIRIFDCIEFNERFRYQDVAEEVAFLAMDLEFNGHPELAAAFVDAYVEASGDVELRELLDFYKAYRAYVRAKVGSFQADDPMVSETDKTRLRETAGRYYELAERYARAFNPQLLVMTCGLTGSGKSTVARRLGERFALTVVRSDVVRKELLGLDPYERKWDDFGAGAYSSDMTERTYTAMVERADTLLATGASVVLDGCFTRRSQRAAAVALAARRGVPLLVLECHAPESVVRERLEGRSTKGRAVSDGRWEIYHHQAAAFEPPTEIPAGSHIVLDRGRPVEENIALLVEVMPTVWKGARPLAATER
jgi:uncharacterized protein